jgi:hypothetical protein
MAQMTDEQQRRLEAATRSVGAKLRALHDGLSADEQAVLGAVLRHGLPASGDEPDDTAGYANEFQTIQKVLASFGLLGDILSNVGEARSEVSTTFGRNLRA